MAKGPKKLRHVGDYRTLRADTYPITGEALDAIAEGFRAMASQGIALPEKTLTWLAARDAVKAQFVKPEPNPEP